MISKLDHEQKLYIKVLAGLFGLLILTIVAAIPHLGIFSQPIALTIAFSKAILVLYFFMELRTSEKLVWVWIGAAFLWVVLLLCGIFMDVLQRTNILPPLL